MVHVRQSCILYMQTVSAFEDYLITLLIENLEMFCEFSNKQPYHRGESMDYFTTT